MLARSTAGPAGQGRGCSHCPRSDLNALAWPGFCPPGRLARVAGCRLQVHPSSSPLHGCVCSLDCAAQDHSDLRRTPTSSFMSLTAKGSAGAGPGLGDRHTLIAVTGSSHHTKAPVSSAAGRSRCHFFLSLRSSECLDYLGSPPHPVFSHGSSCLSCPDVPQFRVRLHPINPPLRMMWERHSAPQILA